MDQNEKLASLGLGVSGLLLSLFYKMHKDIHREADQIKSAKLLSLGPDLKKQLEEIDGHCIHYATVEGFVTPVHQAIPSRRTTEEGVIRQWQLVEHKSRRTQGFWSDVKRTIRNTTDAVPFSVSSTEDRECFVHVRDPTNADFLLDELTVTYDQFELEKTGLLQHGINRMFGEVPQGIQETEKMLLVGSGLIGIGEVCLENKKIYLNAPSSGRFILSKLSRQAIIRKFESRSFIYKVLSVIVGTVGTGLLVYLAWKFTKKYLEYKRNARIMEEFRYAAANSNNVEGQDDANDCVICLTRLRNVVILTCGHVCMCSFCADSLPIPKMCPVCRSPVEQFLPLYRS